jgi:hypothetical protein
MSDQVRQAAANEAVFRQVNEEIESLERGRAQVSDNHMHIVCECADADCAEMLVVPIAEYEGIRRDATLFFVKPGHEILSLEDVVGEGSTYSVVRKHPGEGRRLAKRSDPRSA